MEYLTQRWTLSGPFSAKSGYVYRVLKNGRGGLPPPPTCCALAKVRFSDHFRALIPLFLYNPWERMYAFY